MLNKISAVGLRYYNALLGRIKVPHIADVDETIKLLQQGYSISRFGDGEFYIAMGNDIYFQHADHQLIDTLRKILLSDDPKLLIGLPSPLVSTKNLKSKPGAYWKEYFNTYRSKIYKLIDFNKQYYDTQVSRLYIDLVDKSKVWSRFEEIKKIWEGRSLVIVEGENSRLGVGNDFFKCATHVKRIIAPAMNAFEKRSDIISIVQKHAQRTDIIILALGPTATVLAVDLHKLGFQALDLGHIDIEYEWMLMGAQEKVPVKHKNMWEVKNGELKDDNFADEAYFKSIVAKIL